MQLLDFLYSIHPVDILKINPDGEKNPNNKSNIPCSTRELHKKVISKNNGIKEDTEKK